MRRASRRWPGEPAPVAAAGEAAGRCDAAVERDRELERHARPAVGVGEQVARELTAHLALHQADLHPDAGRPEPSQAASVHDAVRVAHRDHAAPDAGADHRVHAWRRAPLVGAGLERHVERGAARPRAGPVERHRLGVRLAQGLVPALADHATGAHDQRPHHGIGIHASPAALRQTQRARHEPPVILAGPSRHAPVKKPRGRSGTTGRKDDARRTRANTGSPPSSIPTIRSAPESHRICGRRWLDRRPPGRLVPGARRLRSRALPPVGTCAPPRRRCGDGV